MLTTLTMPTHCIFLQVASAVSEGGGLWQTWRHEREYKQIKQRQQRETDANQEAWDQGASVREEWDLYGMKMMMAEKGALESSRIPGGFGPGGVGPK